MAASTSGPAIPAASANAQSPRTVVNVSRTATSTSSAIANSTEFGPFAATLVTYSPASSGSSRARSHGVQAGGRPSPNRRSSTGTATATATPARPNSSGTNQPRRPNTSFG